MPKIDKLSIILRTNNPNYPNVTVPITNPNALWTHQAFNPNFPLVIFVTGWKTNLHTEPSLAQDTLAAAYLCRGNVNFVVKSFSFF